MDILRPFSISARGRSRSIALLAMAVLFTALLPAFTGTAFAATIVVDDDAGACVFGPRTEASVAAAVAAAGPNGTVQVCPGTYAEGRIVIDENLTVVGAGAGSTVINANQDLVTRDATDAWILVESGISFSLSNVALTGGGHQVYQGLRSHGSTTVDNVSFSDFQLPGPQGFAVLGFGGTVPGGIGVDSHAAAQPASTLTVTNSTFSNIGRVGIEVKGTEASATVTGNVYTGKGGGVSLDYGVEVGAGGTAMISGNTISNNQAVAGDGSTSAGILVTDYWGPGTSATITDNDLSNNTAGIHLGYLDSDASVVTATNNRFTGNDFGVHNVSTAVVVDAEGNWWGDDSGPHHATTNPGGGGDKVSDDVDYEPFCVNDTCTPCVGGGGCYATIQEAVDAASAGDTVTVNPGTYAEQITIAKPLSLEGSGVGTVIDAGGASTGVTVSADGVSLEGLLIDKDAQSGSGITFAGSIVQDFALDDVTVTGANSGLRVGSGTTIDGLTVDGSHFDGNKFGWYLAKESAASAAADVTNVTVMDSTFNNNLQKGIYAEKLSDATFDGITVADSGTDPTYGFNAGIDINLKWSAYNDIEIRNSSVTGSGLTGTEPNPTFPAGITIKARDDAPSYNSPAASLDGVLLDNVTVSGGVVGVRFGESGKTNTGPTNVVITNSLLSGSLYALANETSSQTIATGMWWDGSTGPFHVDNAGNGQAILGDVDYSPFCVNSSCTTPPPPPTPTPTPTPTDPGTGDVVTPPDADPLPEEECDPETEICGSTGDDDADINDGDVVTGPGDDHIDVDTDGETEGVTIEAGEDNDTVIVNVGEDTPEGTVIDIDGGEGDDTIVVNIPEGVNVEIIIIGGDGNDTITYPNLEGLDGVTVTTTTGDGDDVVNVPPAPGTVRIVIRLGSGSDAVVVNTGVGAASKAGSGAAVTGGYDIYGGIGPDLVEGSTGNDVLIGNKGRDTIFGKRGNDIIKGGNAKDRLFGGFGDDTIRGGKGKDVAKGGPGNDQLLGI